MPEVEFVCLANSRKMGGQCVAGLRTDGAGWIRPLNSMSWYMLDNGNDVSILDVVRVSLREHRPQPYQPENWTIPDGPLHFVRRLNPAEIGSQLESAIVRGPELLGNQLDRVVKASLEQNPISASLAIVEPSEIQWHITTNVHNRPQYRAKFVLGGCRYDLVITDPIWERKLAGLSMGLHECHEAVERNQRTLFTISLGEPFGGYCYKLVAAVILIPSR